MAITKEEVISQISVDEHGNIGVRKSTRVIEDGNLLSEAYHRHVVDIGSDLSDQDPKVQAIAAAVWTPELLAAKAKRLEASSQ
jgi:hypothetical protein